MTRLWEGFASLQLDCPLLQLHRGGNWWFGGRLALDLQMGVGAMPNHHVPPTRRPLNENQRPLWIIIFAILLASIAIRTQGQETASARLSALPTQLHRPLPLLPASTEPLSTEPLSTERVRSMRPQSAFVSAELGQFDADPDPDGWLARVVLLGADEQPVTVRRATAKFELVPRLPTHDYTGYVTANVKPILWTVPLTFGEDDTATVRLPLTAPIRPLIGWPSTSHPAVGDTSGFDSARRGIIRHTAPAFEARTVVTDVHDRGNVRFAIGMARFGQLKIRVSVPGEGVFDAIAPVTLRPSVLVDTRWPYQ